jgi:hypothetical protein
MTKHPIHQPRAGRQCKIAEVRGTQIAFIFDDGSEEVHDFDITTREGQLLFAVEAEKLGFGKRRDLASFVAGPMLDGPILQR